MEWSWKSALAIAAVGVAAWLLLDGGNPMSRPTPPLQAQLTAILLVVLGDDIDTVVSAMSTARTSLAVTTVVVGDTPLVDQQQLRSALHGRTLPNANVVFVHAGEAGSHAALARAVAGRPADFVLIVCAGTTFEHNWDDRLCTQYRSLAERVGPRVVLTNEPVPQTFLAFNHQPSGLPTCVPLSTGLRAATTPMTTALWTPHFSFAPASVHALVPFDANLAWGGSEADVVYAARLHAAGVRAYHPVDTPLRNQTPQGIPCISTEAAAARALRRLRTSLGLLRLQGQAQLTQQELEEYSNFAGVDLLVGRVSDHAAWGLTTATNATEYYVKTGVV